MAYFRVLGTLELVADGPRQLRGRKVRQLLGLLLANTGQVVPVDSVIEELWGEAAPATAVATVRTHVFHLRRQLAAHLGKEAARELLHTRSPGYLVVLDDDQLDLRIFHQVRNQGRTLMRERRFEEALDRFDQALSLWRGPFLGDVAQGSLLEAQSARAAHAHTRLRELRVEALMELGGHRDVVDELRDQVNEDPLNEWLHTRLIDALHRCGRRGEALRAVRDLRDLLDTELGLEPSEEIRLLQQRILAAP
ncbi:AfsR/SARP family transcriptional regulator [Nocardiopsis terrae]